MRLNKSDFIKIIGIGAFLFLSVIEFSSFVEYVLRHLQIAIFNESFGFQWLPELVGLIIFSSILISIFNNTKKLLEIKFKNLLLILICVFFGILLLQFFYPFWGTDFILENYPQEFSTYYEARADSNTQFIIGTIQIIKYVVFTVVLFFKI